MRLGEWHLDRKLSGFEFEPRDLWVGIYWNRGEAGLAMDPWAKKDRDAFRRLAGLVVAWVDVYVCLVPAIPLRLRWIRRRPILEPPAYSDEVVDTEERPGVMSRLRKLGKEEE